MTPMQKLTLEILNECMSIVERKVDNPIYKKVLFSMGFPYAKKKILSSSDEELKKDMNLIYMKLKKYYEKKQFKDTIEEANKISDIPVPKFLSDQVGNYF
jgi:hypothetical protein